MKQRPLIETGRVQILYDQRAGRECRGHIGKGQRLGAG
jgi:hypothetical protein